MARKDYESVNADTSALEDKLKNVTSPSPSTISANESEGELIIHSPKSQLRDKHEEQKAKTKYNLVKKQKAFGGWLDEDLHTEFKIMCIRLGKTQEDWLVEQISKAVEKNK